MPGHDYTIGIFRDHNEEGGEEDGKPHVPIRETIVIPMGTSYQVQIASKKPLVEQVIGRYN
jgi:hypothetical protein